MAATKVKALRTGWDGLQRRREGDEFPWPEGRKLASWVEPVDPKDAKAAAESDKERGRAEHAKLMRDGFGGNVSPAAQAQSAPAAAPSK